jgi:hypothetical protein
MNQLRVIGQTNPLVYSRLINASEIEAELDFGNRRCGLGHDQVYPFHDPASRHMD